LSYKVWKEEDEAASKAVLTRSKTQLYKYNFASYMVRRTFSSVSH
jgi:hypothetical protein